MSRHMSLCRNIISSEMTELGHDIISLCREKYDLAIKCLLRH